MRIFDTVHRLPPIGAITSLDMLTPGRKLYLVGPSPSDKIPLAIRVAHDGVRLNGSGRVETIDGLHVWNVDIWQACSFYATSLNLITVENPKPNNFNDAYLFAGHKQAYNYSDWCFANPDVKWITINRHKVRTDVQPFLAKRVGCRKRPDHEDPKFIE